MDYYLAPMEGITGHVFRGVYHECFGGIDKYFTPFISPNRKRICRAREKNDILPENNKGMKVVPQILTNHDILFQNTVNYLKEYGYHEVNLNLGCPVGTVVSRKKGAGFLGDKKALEEFLEKIFAANDVKISVKTRIGVESAAEFEELIELFNQFPIYELIVHPRTREQFYRGKPNKEAFACGVKNYRGRICYNGNIFSKEDMDELTGRFSSLELVMLGRGILQFPGLVRFLREGKSMKKEELRCFHERLCEGYQQALMDDNVVLFKMKEIWSYLISSFLCEPEERAYKRIKKAKTMEQYKAAVKELFLDYELRQ